MLTSLNDEAIEVEAFLDGAFKPVAPEHQYLKDWRLYFKQEDPLHFENRGFEVVKTLILNRVGIFPSKRRYDVLETSTDTLVKFMQRNYILRKDNESEDQGECLSPTKVFPTNSQEKRSSIIFKAASNDIADKLNTLGIDHRLDLSQNQFLAEYYLVMRKRLTSLFLCSIIDDQDIFSRKEDSLGAAMKTTLGLVPMFGDLLKIAGIVLVMVKDMNLKRKLARISDLAVNYADFPEKIAKLMSLLRANAIMQSVNPVDQFKKTNVISEALVKFGLLKDLTPPELLAFNDAKIIEGALLALIETKQINVINFPDINDLQCRLVTFILETETIRLNLDIQEATTDTKGEGSSPDNKVYTEVIIDKDILLKNDYLPNYLLRQKGEQYKEYYDRINKYLKVRSFHVGS